MRARLTTLQTILDKLELFPESPTVSTGVPANASAAFDGLDLHPRIAETATESYRHGHHAEAVFAASKALVNYVRERSGRDDLDGAALMRTVFSRQSPILAFNTLKDQTDGTLKDQTDGDEQEGMMHLLEGAVLAIRNPGGHDFPQLSPQRAAEYIALLNLLANRVKEAKKRP